MFDMPEYRIAPLYTSVVACCTGPSGGICQLEADKDKDVPTPPPGTNSLYKYVHTQSSIALLRFN